jgi:hypothetical protein
MEETKGIMERRTDLLVLGDFGYFSEINQRL